MTQGIFVVMALTFLTLPPSSTDSPAGPGAGAGVRLPWQRLPQQRALPERRGGRHLPHGLRQHRPQLDDL